MMMVIVQHFYMAMEDSVLVCCHSLIYLGLHSCNTLMVSWPIQISEEAGKEI